MHVKQILQNLPYKVIRQRLSLFIPYKTVKFFYEYVRKCNQIATENDFQSKLSIYVIIGMLTYQMCHQSYLAVYDGNERDMVVHFDFTRLALGDPHHCIILALLGAMGIYAYYLLYFRADHKTNDLLVNVFRHKRCELFLGATSNGKSVFELIQFTFFKMANATQVYTFAIGMWEIGDFIIF